MDNKEIIQDIRSGNKDAIKTVYQDYAKDIYNFSKSITGDHDSAMEATKKTFINLFTNIQNGESPADIRLAALKIAYNESCAIAMPGSAAAEVLTQPEAPKSVSGSSKVVGDGVIDTPEEMEDIMRETDSEVDVPSWKREPSEAELPEEKEAESSKETAENPEDIGNTQVFNISMDYDKEGELVIDESEEISDTAEKSVASDEEDESEEEAEAEREPRKKGVTALIIIINIILILILLWLLYGLLINFGVLPQVADLGYTWFNETIYPLF